MYSLFLKNAWILSIFCGEHNWESSGFILLFAFRDHSWWVLRRQYGMRGIELTSVSVPPTAL